MWLWMLLVSMMRFVLVCGIVLGRLFLRCRLDRMWIFMGLVLEWVVLV